MLSSLTKVLGGAHPLSDGQETGHLMFGNVNLLAAESGERDVGDLVRSGHFEGSESCVLVRFRILGFEIR